MLIDRRLVAAPALDWFYLLALLFEPETALLFQIRPGGIGDDARAAAATVHRLTL